MNFYDTKENRAAELEGPMFLLRWMLGILAFLWLIGSMVS